MAQLNHHITPEHQQELRLGTVKWSADRTMAHCGHLRGDIMWSETRIGWRTPETEGVKWIDTRLGVVSELVAKQYEAIAREHVIESLQRLASETCTEVLDNPSYTYKTLVMEGA